MKFGRQDFLPPICLFHATRGRGALLVDIVGHRRLLHARFCCQMLEAQLPEWVEIPDSEDELVEETGSSKQLSLDHSCGRSTVQGASACAVAV